MKKDKNLRGRKNEKQVASSSGIHILRGDNPGITKSGRSYMKWFDRLMEDWIIPLVVIGAIVTLALLYTG